MQPPASLSRDLQSSAASPSLVHSLHETRSSVLSLAANEDYIFSGSQNRHISVSLRLSGLNASQLGCCAGMGQEYIPIEEYLAWAYRKRSGFGICSEREMAI